MRTKCLPINLSPDLYERLEQRALAEERDPLQQARWLLRQALTTEGDDRAPLPPSGRRQRHEKEDVLALTA